MGGIFAQARDLRNGNRGGMGRRLFPNLHPKPSAHPTIDAHTPAQIHDMMTFNVPRGLKFITVSVILMGLCTLYFQAASSHSMDLVVAFGLLAFFMISYSNVIAAVGLTLPLKAVAAGTFRRTL